MSIKQGRVGERIQTILSELLRREVSDPRLYNVTVTEVNLDPELMFADVYVNALGDESRQEQVMKGLKSASGFLRREVGKRVQLRNTPELHFHWDETLERGENMNQLLAKLHIPPASDVIEDDDEDGDYDDDESDEFDDHD
ncbi:MAG TPA: 30S ribosome-binding factor RbfA [Aggregatilineales bacterium]|nr:30S ribosome-binding factor RbfA [Aggregatilineales bacterium]